MDKLFAEVRKCMSSSTLIKSSSLTDRRVGSQERGPRRTEDGDWLCF